MKQHRGAGTMASLTLAVVFGVTLLLSLITGAGVYRRVEDRVEKSAEERVGLTYITARLRNYDRAGSVRTGSFGGGDAVFLLQEEDGVSYQTILYVYGGWLRELMCEEGQEPGPESGQTISEADSLVLEEPGSGLLRLRYTPADGETQTADLFLRSGGE